MIEILEISYEQLAVQIREHNEWEAKQIWLEDNHPGSYSEISTPIPLHMTYKFNRIFDSLVPELTGDIERMDHRLRTITTEARSCGVSSKYLEQLLRDRFWKLVQEVIS
jgi:hypothetical protein